jgi:metal-responsive CopG/Arc/MetJ family transcriptional regulator
MSKIIQVPIDEPLLEALDEASKEHGTSRAALVRTACRDFLRRWRERKLDEQYAEGYRRIPDDPAVGDAQLRMAAEVLPKEEW